MSPAGERDEVVVANYSAIERLMPPTGWGRQCGGVRWSMVILDREGEMI